MASPENPTNLKTQYEQERLRYSEGGMDRARLLATIRGQLYHLEDRIDATRNERDYYQRTLAGKIASLFTENDERADEEHKLVVTAHEKLQKGVKGLLTLSTKYADTAERFANNGDYQDALNSMRKANELHHEVAPFLKQEITDLRDGYETIQKPTAQERFVQGVSEGGLNSIPARARAIMDFPIEEGARLLAQALKEEFAQTVNATTDAAGDIKTRGLRAWSDDRIGDMQKGVKEYIANLDTPEGIGRAFADAPFAMLTAVPGARKLHDLLDRVGNLASRKKHGPPDGQGGHTGDVDPATPDPRGVEVGEATPEAFAAARARQAEREEAAKRTAQVNAQRLNSARAPGITVSEYYNDGKFGDPWGTNSGRRALDPKD